MQQTFKRITGLNLKKPGCFPGFFFQGSVEIACDKNNNSISPKFILTSFKKKHNYKSGVHNVR